MTRSPLCTEILEELNLRKDSQRAHGASAYMKRALPFLGVTMPEVRRIASAAVRSHPLGTSSAYQITLKELFFAATHQEQRYAALCIAGQRSCRRFQKPQLLPLYRRMITTAAWWDIVDDLSTRVGEIYLDAPQRTRPVLLTWAHANDIWLRRCAIICQRKHKEHTDLPLLYACISPSLPSREFFLQKGIGWALRSLAWSNPEEVLRYVRQQGPQLAPLSRREALKNINRAD